MGNNNVKAIREQNNITQEELARLCNVSKNTIYNIEKDRHIPNLLLAYKIKKVLNCKYVEEIFPD